MFAKKIKFYCSLNEVLEQYPIVPSKEVRFDWFKKAGNSYKQEYNKKYHIESIASTAKCPGIHNIFDNGYIMQTWFDFTIKPIDSKNFEFYIPKSLEEYLQNTNFKSNLISWFDSNNPSFAVPIHENNLQTLIKIITPWTVEIPRGWELMIEPIPYPDQTDFTATSGILKSGNLFEINPIIIWHTMSRPVTIKAGSPICRLIPRKIENPKLDLLNTNDYHKKRMMKWKYDIGHRFVRNQK